MANDPRTGEPIPDVIPQPVSEAYASTAPMSVAAPTIKQTADAEMNKDLWGAKAGDLNTLYDTTTGKQSRLAFADIPQALVDGKVGFKKDELIPMLAPDGTAGTIPGINVTQALLQGYKLEGAQQKAVREYVQDNKGISGTLKVGLGKFADEALFGIPEIIMDHTADPLEIAKKEALKNDHEIANAAGGIGGFGASMFYGGELFHAATKGGKLAQTLVRGGEKLTAEAIAEKGIEAAGKQLVGKLVASGAEKAAAEAVAPGLLRETAANMAKYGVEGAIITAPRTITEAMLITGKGIANDNLKVSDYAPVAEHVAFGIGAGALLGVPGPLGGKFLKMTKELGKYAPKYFDSLRPENLVLKGAGIERASAKKLGIDNLENAGKILLDEGVVNKGMSFKTLQKSVSEFKTTNGEAIGSIVKEIDSIAEKSGQVPELFQTAPVIEKLAILREEFNQPIYKIEMKELDRIMATVEKQPEKLVRYEGPKAVQEGAYGGTPYADIGHGTLTLESAQKLKGMMGDLAKWDHMAKGKLNEVRREAYFAVRDEVDNAIGRIAENTDRSLAERFHKAKDNYKAAKDIEYLLDNKEAKLNGNKVFGHTYSIWGGSSGAVGLGISAVTGNFLPLILPLLTLTGKKALESTYLQTSVASMLHGLSLNKSGLLFAEQAMKYGAEQLDRIPDILKGPLSPAARETTPLNAIARFLGHDSKDTTITERQKLLDDLAFKVHSINYNQQQTADKIAKMALPLSMTGAEKISQAYTAQTIKTFQYLQSILPNADKTINPFKENTSKVSDTQLANFEKSLRIVENPYSILNDLQTGTVTQGQVDTLRAIYPNIYDQVKERITKLGGQGDLKGLTYSTRLKLSLLMGVSFDDSINQVPSYQSNFMAAKGGGAKASGGGANLVSQKSNPMMTSIQALANRK